MSDRQVYATFLVVVMCVFALLAYTCGGWARAERDGAVWERTVVHLEAKCDQRPDGSAECEPGAWSTIPTTTTSAP